MQKKKKPLKTFDKHFEASVFVEDFWMKLEIVAWQT